MQTTTRIIELREALKTWNLGKTSFYSRINPHSANFDPECPRPFPLGDGANAKRAFEAADVERYLEVIVQRGRARAQASAAAAREVAAQLVAARKQRRAANAGE